MRRIVLRWSVLVVLAGAIALLPSTSALAHPLGNFTVNLYSGLQVVPGQVRIDYVVDMAEIPTFQEMPSIDVNGDGVASADEKSAWARDEAPKLLANVQLTLDGNVVALHVRSASMRFRPGQGGLPILRFEGTFAGQLAARAGSIAYVDRNFGDHIGWREITATGEDGEALAGSTVPVASVSDALLSYPQDLLQSPLRVTSMKASFHPGVGVTGDETSGRGSVTASRPLEDSGLFPALIANRGPGFVLLALALAMAFGAWHALLPGHGKTLMAAYMVGSEARMRQTIAIGSAVAMMHTASVLGLGVLVLTLERTFRPETLYPWLGLLSGLVAVGLGAYLMIARLSSWAAARRDDSVGHDAHHGSHHEHDHDHHSHELSNGVSPTSRRGLLALALAGGILPSPSALLVLLAAIESHRVVYGLALILAFSAGLAGALIAIGLGALKAREAMARRLSTFWGRLVPVLSAALIVGVGLFLAARGVVQIPRV